MPKIDASVLSTLSLTVPGTDEPVRAFEVVPGSPTYLLANGGSRAERTFLVAWDDRHRLCQALLGYSKLANVDSVERRTSTYVTRYPPHAMPDLLDPVSADRQPHRQWWLYATQVTGMEGLEPLQEAELNALPSYRWARLKVLYEGLTYRILSDEQLVAESEWIRKSSINGVPNPDPDHAYEWYIERYVTRTVKPTVEYLSLGRGKMKYVDENKDPFPDGAAVVQASAEVVYTWHQVPFLPRGARQHIGKVNRDWFDPEHESHFKPQGNTNEEFHGFAPGTLLYTSAEVRPYRTAVGTFVQDVTYRMKHMERFDTTPGGARLLGRGHNYFLRWDKDNSRLRYYKVTDNGEEDEIGDPIPGQVKAPGTGRAVFPYADFRELFTLYPNQ